MHRLLGPLAAVLLTAALPAAAAAADRAAVQRALDRVVRADGGPPGAVATLHRDGSTVTVRSGRANVRTGRRPRATDRMRIASVSKAFSGAAALALVKEGRLALADTIAQRRPDLPAAWGAVTLAQLLQHTSGLPDYTRSDAFARQLTRRPQAYVSPATIISWVAADGLGFAPGSRYAYSNTDNIVVALMVEAVTGRRYEDVLRERVTGPLGLRHTTLVPRRLGLPTPDLRGYGVAPGERPQDITTALSPSGAWSSGGIVSTPRELNAFVRAYVGGRLADPALRAAQRRVVPGRSSPPGPGANASGLALFRYATRCGTVYGHTGSFPGYTQFIAATPDGRRGATVAVNAALPDDGRPLRLVRAAMEAAVCALR